MNPPKILKDSKFIWNIFSKIKNPDKAKKTYIKYEMKDALNKTLINCLSDKSFITGVKYIYNATGFNTAKNEINNAIIS